MNSKTFENDIEFLKKYYKIILLKDPLSESMVAVCPELQSKIMTSTFDGMKGPSLGWINYELISSQKVNNQINPVGGEDRFWLGPEGGQFSIFFAPGKSFTLDNCYTPSALDREPFDLIFEKGTQAVFRKNLEVKNFSGTQFKLTVERDIKILTTASIEQLLSIKLPDEIKSVGFESDNRVTNTGTHTWTKAGGLLSIWILGMFPPSSQTMVLFPFHEGDDSTLGPIVNDAYFGKVPKDRLQLKNNLLLFKGDGKYRSKIGLSHQRAKSIMGSFDAEKNILTVCTYTKPEESKDYVNSLWHIQTNPFDGDIINSYNDGPTESSSFGGFYELESSSPALALGPDQSYKHIHRTYHFSGQENQLNELCNQLFNITTKEIKSLL